MDHLLNSRSLAEELQMANLFGTNFVQDGSAGKVDSSILEMFQTDILPQSQGSFNISMPAFYGPSQSGEMGDNVRSAFEPQKPQAVTPSLSQILS